MRISAPVLAANQCAEEKAMERSKRRARRRKAGKLPKELERVNLDAAGIDIGSERHFVAIPEGRYEVSVREFGTFTSDLQDMGAWLKRCGVTTVAMESTGVYWIPAYELLERE